MNEGSLDAGYRLATDAQFKELSNFSLPPRAGRITAIEASGQVRVETDDPDGGDVLAWPLNGFTYAVDDVVYLGFAVNSPDSAIVIGSLGHLPLLSHVVVGTLDHGSELTGLSGDDHVQYALLAGRSGGQTLRGDIGSAGALVLMSTAHATKGKILFGTSAYDEVNNRLGVQTAAPTKPVQVGAAVTDMHAAGAMSVINNTAGAEFSAATAAGSTSRSGFSLIRSRGDFTTPTAVQADDSLGFVAFKGYDGATIQAPALLEAFVDGIVSSGVVPARLSFITGSNGATRAARLTIFNDGTMVTGGLTSVGANQLGVKAGASANDAAVGGTLYETRTATGNAGAGETDLAAYSVPANTLSVDGMSVWFEASGSCAANLNAKTLRVRFGTAGVNLILSATVTGSGAGAKWVLQGRVVRSGASAEKGYASVSGTFITAAADVVTTLNQANNTATTLKITGQATANNDIVLETFRAEWSDANV
jgi:hypothetical protein